MARRQSAGPFARPRLPFRRSMIYCIHRSHPSFEKQISSSVRWQQSVENMIRQGVDTFVEIGPGRTLAGFMRKIDRNVKVYNIQTVEDAEKVCQELV